MDRAFSSATVTSLSDCGLCCMQRKICCFRVDSNMWVVVEMNSSCINAANHDQ